MAGNSGRRMLSKPRWYLLVAVVGSMMALSGANVAYTNYSVRRSQSIADENDRRWCQLLTTLDEAYRTTPPQSDTGRLVASNIHDLRAALGCGS